MSAEMPPIDIHPDHWKIVQRILQKHVPDLEVWAFGSRAKGSAKEFSDLDLAIITDEPLPIDTSAALNKSFSDSDLPWKVEVADWSSVSGFHRSVIENSRVVVQEVAHKRPRKVVTLGEICREQNGYIQTGPFGSQLHAYDYSANGTPVVMPVNIVAGRINESGIARVSDSHVERLIRHKLESGNIVFSRRGDVTRFALVSDRESGWICGTGCLKVVIGTPSIAVSRYIAAVLSTRDSKEWLERHAVGATMPNLNTEILAALPVVLPSIQEQRAIAHILGTLDDKIELNRKQNETLEAMARAMFKAWFVDFEPVRAKMEGRWKRGQSLPGMPAHLYDLFPDRMADSEFGEIPEGWEITSLSEYSSLSLELRKKRSHSGEIRYVDLSNTKWGRIESVTHYNLSDAPSRAQRVLRPLDTIFGTVRPGNGSYAFISEEGLTGSTGFAVLRPLRREYSEFIYLSATAQSNIERLSNLADGGVYPAVHPESVSGTRVPRIGNELINEFSLQVSPMISDIAGNERMSGVLAKLRDALLPGLISGKVRVGGDMKLLGEVL
jgi:UPI00006A2470 related cluster